MRIMSHNKQQNYYVYLERFERSGKRSPLFLKRKDDYERRNTIRMFLSRDVRVSIVQLRALRSRTVHLFNTQRTVLEELFRRLRTMLQVADMYVAPGGRIGGQSVI